MAAKYVKRGVSLLFEHSFMLLLVPVAGLLMVSLWRDPFTAWTVAKYSKWLARLVPEFDSLLVLVKAAPTRAHTLSWLNGLPMT